MATAEQMKQPKRLLNQSGKQKMPKREKQERTQRIVKWAGLGVLAVATVSLILGLVFAWYIPTTKLSRVFLKVGDREFTMRYYFDALYYQAHGYGWGPSSTYIFVESIPDLIIDTTLINEYGDKENINITDAEVKEFLKKYGFKNTQAGRDIAKASLIREYLIETLYPEQMGDATAQRYVYAMLLEDMDAAQHILDRIDDGEDFFDLARPTNNLSSVISSSELKWLVQEMLDYKLKSKVAGEAVFGAEIGQFICVVDDEASKKVGYVIVKILDRETNGTTERVKIAQIVLNSAEEAQQILDQLAEGADFAALAREYSVDEDTAANGGEVNGFKVRSEFSAAIAEFAFGRPGGGDDPGQEAAEIGVISDVIRDTALQTKGGVWIFLSTEGGDNIPLTQDQKNEWISAKNTILQNNLKEANEDRIQNLFDDELKAYARERL